MEHSHSSASLSRNFSSGSALGELNGEGVHPKVNKRKQQKRIWHFKYTGALEIDSITSKSHCSKCSKSKVHLESKFHFTSQLLLKTHLVSKLDFKIQSVNVTFSG
jgi:hypothetical protein